MTNDDLTLLAKGRIPAALILPPVLERLEIADRQREPDETGELILLCERQELDYATIYRTLQRFQHPESNADVCKSLDFDTADKLLCGLGLEGMWRSELLDFYLKVDLSWKKCECPGCETWFRPVHAAAGETGQKFCSISCRYAARKIRRGESSRRRKNWGGTKSKCRNGHFKTPENIYMRANGKQECLVCRRAANNASYARRKAKERGTLVATA